LLALAHSASPQETTGGGFKLVLPDHNGQLSWTADGFKITQSSAKPGGREIGIRGEESSGRLAFLGFLFLAPKGDTLTSSQCRDNELAEQKRENSDLKVLSTASMERGNGLPVSTATYTTTRRDGGTEFHVRGVVASGDICGDLEIYSKSLIRGTDADVAKILSTYRFDATYKPEFADIVIFGQVLYDEKSFQAAAPTFERALTMLPKDGAPFPSATVARRVLTDQAGMAYGISGNLGKARSIFETAIATDPDYPLYYYNLASADAGEGKLSDARLHLQKAFDRKANLIPGETMPDPSTDDSFVPYKTNRDFWAFVQRFHGGK
jgi:tetratricopeptide (TPR) repeat protein